MIKPPSKKLAAFLIISFLAAFFTFLCCCSQEYFPSNAEKSSHVHEENHSHDSHQTHSHTDKDSSCNHRDCKHEQILSSFISAPVFQIYLPSAQCLKMLQKVFIDWQFAKNPFSSQIAFHDTGPPLSLFKTEPLYLQLSVLRI